jgi:cytoskeletal protein CcmA (bactofilin family)
MSFLLDDAAFGGQVMIGAGIPLALGLGAGEKPKIRGSAFIEGPVQMGRAGAFVETGEGPALKATLMVGQTTNVDCGEEKPEKSVYVMGDVVIDGRQEGATESKARTLLVQGTAKIEGFPDLTALLVQGKVTIVPSGEEGAISEPGVTLFLVLGDVEVAGSIRVEGEVTGNGGADVLSAKKNFDIPHPTKEGWRLTHTCVEGPEAAVYIRGRVKNKTEIELPLYWKDLVDIQSITVNLTPIGAHQDVIIKRWDEKKIYLQAKGGMPIDCFYYIMAERKDTEKLIPEYEGTIEDYPGDNSQRSIVGYHYDVKS